MYPKYIKIKSNYTGKYRNRVGILHARSFRTENGSVVDFGQGFGEALSNVYIRYDYMVFITKKEYEIEKVLENLG